MKNLVLLLIIFLATGCGSKSEDAVIPVTENAEVKEDNSLLPVEKMCDIFSQDHNLYAVEFGEAFSNLKDKCDQNATINQKTQDAVMDSFKMASEVFETFDKNAHSKCVPQGKNLIKSVYSAHLLTQKNETQNVIVQKALTKSRIDNLFRSLIRYNCLNDFETFSYIYKDEEKTFEFNSNFLTNGSFEFIKVDKNYVTLSKQWTLVEKGKFPGWNIVAVNPVDGKICNLVEVQGANVVTTVPDGSHIIELDSHCKNDQGQNVTGDARIELRQNLPLKSTGSYKLTMKAQKRSGLHGDLQVAVYQLGRDREFNSISLPNQAVWSEVCIDVDIQEIEKDLKINIRDGEENSRETFGLLLDDVRFEKGACP